MENFSKGQSKFHKIALKDVNFLNSIASQEKHIDEIALMENTLMEQLVNSKNMSEETQRHPKPVVTRPGIMCGSYKVHKKCVDG